MVVVWFVRKKKKIEVPGICCDSHPEIASYGDNTGHLNYLGTLQHVDLVSHIDGRGFEYMAKCAHVCTAITNSIVYLCAFYLYEKLSKENVITVCIIHEPVLSGDAPYNYMLAGSTLRIIKLL